MTVGSSLQEMRDGCPCCGSDDSSSAMTAAQDYVTHERFAVRQCHECGVAFTWPRPREMDRYYPTRYRSYVRCVSATLRILYKLQVRAWSRTLGHGAVLEIGCGSGWMLKVFASHGWRVVGVERSLASAHEAGTTFKVPVYVGSLDAIKANGRFDLILLYQVLEHLSNPSETLSQCNRLLKPGGTLIVAVPNFGSWQARLFREQWFHLDVPRHLVHFTKESLSRVLGQCGFRIDGYRYFSLHDPYGWIQSTLNRLGFQQNLLTDFLMRRRYSAETVLKCVVMGGVSLILFVPSLMLAFISWALGEGALIEVRAIRKQF
jgi:SAM-dependent methyltransferase